MSLLVTRLNILVQLRSFLIIIIVLLAIEIAARLDLLPVFFPAPSVVISALSQMLRDGEILPNTLITFRRLLMGGLIGGIPGLVLGLIMGASPNTHRLFSPFFSAIHPIPRIALVPLFIVIFGIREDSKLMIIATATFFPLLYNTISGVKQINKTYFDVAKNFQLNLWQTFIHILFRGSLPSILSGLRLSLNHGLAMAVAVELLVSRDGLGSLVDLSWRTMRIDELYASLICIGLIGIALDQGVMLLENRFADWDAT